MKYKIGFRLDWLEMIFVFFSIFFAGILISSDLESNYLVTGLLIIPSGVLLLKKRVKIPKK